MPLLRWSRPLLATALVLAGCKSNPPAATDAGVATAPAPSKAPPSTPPRALFSGPALSYLKPEGSERCEWVRQPLPAGEPTTVFTFNADCTRSRVAWSPDGREGLVFTWPVGEGAQARIWRVDFAAKTGKPLDLKELPGGTGEQSPDKPYVDQVAFDAQGRPVALVSDVYSSREAEKGQDGGRFISFEGQRYPIPGGEGSPGLALAYRLEGGTWKRFEAKGSLYEGTNAPEVRALEAARSLSTSEPSAELPGQKASESTAQKLDTALPGQDETGRWMSLTTPGGTLHYRAQQKPEDESLYQPSAPVRWEQEGKLVELEGLTVEPGDRLGIQLQGDLLLITGPSSGYTFDTRAKKKLVFLQDIEGATFWPEASKP